jgi:L-lactate permease
MSLLYALFAGMSIAEVVGGLVMLFISAFAVFFWGSGLGWREPKKDRRNGL